MTVPPARLGLVVTSSSEQAAAAFRVHNLPNGAPTEPGYNWNGLPTELPAPGYFQHGAVYGGECFDEFGALDDGVAAGGDAVFHGRTLLYHLFLFCTGNH